MFIGFHDDRRRPGAVKTTAAKLQFLNFNAVKKSKSLFYQT